MELRNKKTLIVGAARTGIALARFLNRQGSDVTLADVKTEDQLGGIPDQIKATGVRLALGPHRKEDFLSCDLIVLSPGVAHTMDILAQARTGGIPVIGEIELASRFIQEPIVAITGTNGKTTTTQLVGDMMQSSGLNVFVGGNIGNPLIGYVDQEKKADVVVAEVSSFQLDTIETFRPTVGVLLNITQDHLDRYDGFDAYVRSKARLFENQLPSDVAVLNGSDECVRKASSGIAATVLTFAGRAKGASNAWVEEDGLVCRVPGKAPIALDMSHFALTGIHNLENAAAAALASLAAGATVEGVQKTLSTFEAQPHRLEWIRTHRDVRYYNDSKGTNVDAVVRALESFDAPIILIMGGRDKGGDYAPLNALVKKKVKQLILIGEARAKIMTALGGLTRTETAENLETATIMASRSARPKDIVLLSPGCSSFDMFTDYKERGDVFRRMVKDLPA